jgi:hypothetical protein
VNAPATHGQSVLAASPCRLMKIRRTDIERLHGLATFPNLLALIQQIKQVLYPKP